MLKLKKIIIKVKKKKDKVLNFVILNLQIDMYVGNLICFYEQ